MLLRWWNDDTLQEHKWLGVILDGVWPWWSKSSTDFPAETSPCRLTAIVIRLVPRADKMKQILPCDWLKIEKIRDRVDSRIQCIWSLRIMGSWNNLVMILPRTQALLGLFGDWRAEAQEKTQLFFAVLALPVIPCANRRKSLEAPGHEAGNDLISVSVVCLPSQSDFVSSVDGIYFQLLKACITYSLDKSVSSTANVILFGCFWQDFCTGQWLIHFCLCSVQISCGYTRFFLHIHSTG